MEWATSYPFWKFPIQVVSTFALCICMPKTLSIYLIVRKSRKSTLKPAEWSNLLNRRVRPVNSMPKVHVASSLGWEKMTTLITRYMSIYSTLEASLLYTSLTKRPFFRLQSSWKMYPLNLYKGLRSLLYCLLSMPSRYSRAIRRKEFNGTRVRFQLRDGTN